MTFMSEKKPNLIFFNPDQWRGDVMGHMGNPAAKTPHLDSLVETDAVSFSNAFCQNPVCTPSRCSFMTGWYPHVRGHRTMHHLLQSHEPCLLSELKKNGYQIWWGGKNDLVSDPEAYAACVDIRDQPHTDHRDMHVDLCWRKEVDGGPDRSFLAGCLEKHAGEDVYLDKDWAHVLSACEYLKNRKEDDPPFCLYLPLLYPHPPYGVEEPYFSAIDRELLPDRIGSKELKEKPRTHQKLREAFALEGREKAWWDELRATYYGMCMRVDAQVGMLLDTLKACGLYDESAFFLFSDHGDYTGDYDLVEKAQNQFEDCLTRVPFIIKPPASLGKVSGIRTGLVELVDFSATVYDFAGIDPDYTHFGRSLRHLLEKDGNHREAVFCEGGRLRGEEHCKETGSEHPDDLYAPRVWIQRADDVAHGKALMCRDQNFKLVCRLYEADEFYDMENDPAEMKNVIHDPAYSGEIARMNALVRTFLLETGDVVPHQLDSRN
jgi:arylsulfatase A-like enzyme